MGGCCGKVAVCRGSTVLLILTLASANVLNIPAHRVFRCLLICGPIEVANVVQIFRVMVT